MEAGDDVGFALDPARVVGGGAGQGGVEEGLIGVAEAADIDDDLVLAGDGEFAEGEAEARRSRGRSGGSGDRLPGG